MVNGKYIICRHTFKTLSLVDPVGSVLSGWAPPFFENVLKLCENCRKWDCYYLFFILEPLFKLSGSKPLKKTKQNKTKKQKNIDLLNAHLKPEQFIDGTILCHIQHIHVFLVTNMCDNMVHIHFLQKVQFNITRLSFLKINGYRYISNNISHY
jgi:hypothetical protein